ncbi:MAG TPA: hypothetical protein VFS43_43315, partial [Polyangiaceae bacterium]|nr:hypothetical protein [Polyangiaceae bacterium]
MKPNRAKLSPRPLRGLVFASLTSLAFLGLHCSSTPALEGANRSAAGDDDSYGAPGDRPSSPGAPYAPGGGEGAERPPVNGTDGSTPTEAPACASLDSTKPLELFLSADDSNSMASPVIARRMIRQQRGVPPSHVLRTYEFLNYYNVNYGNVAPGTLGVDAQLRVNAAGEYELQIGVQAPPREVRRPMTLTFVLD